MTERKGFQNKIGGEKEEKMRENDENMKDRKEIQDKNRVYRGKDAERSRREEAERTGDA